MLCTFPTKTHQTQLNVLELVATQTTFDCNFVRSIIQSTVNLTTPSSYADRHDWKLKTGLFQSYV